MLIYSLCLLVKKRSKQNPNIYVQLVESYRQDGKMNQRVIKHIGTAPSEEHLEKNYKTS